MFRLFLLLSVALYCVALFLPIYAAKPDLIGLMALVGGWMVAANDWPTAISWFANVTYILSVVMILKRKKPRAMAAMVYAVLSVALGCAILGAGKAYLGQSQTVGKLALGTAFYAWLGSFVLMTVAAWFKMKSQAAKANTSSAAEVKS